MPAPVFALTGEIITVGRLPGNTLQLADPSVSARHAWLRPLPGGFCLCHDLHSTNGTKINGRRIEEGTLHDGDRVAFGGVVATYRAASSAAAAEVANSGDNLPTAAGSAPLQIEVGTVLEGEYRLEESLGDGPGYESFRATDLRRGTPASLKILDPAAARDRQAFALIAEEVGRVQAAPHPHFIRLLRLRRWTEGGFLVAEWIEGIPLLDLLRYRHALPVAEALIALRQAAAVADHAWQHGLRGLDLALRPSLICLPENAPEAARPRELLERPLEKWPKFHLKFDPRVIQAPGAPMQQAPFFAELAALACELLGSPLAARTGATRCRTDHAGPTLVGKLGEAGNRALCRALDSGPEAFATHAAFVEALAPPGTSKR